MLNFNGFAIHRGRPGRREGLQCAKAHRARRKEPVCHQGNAVLDLARIRKDPVLVGMVLLHLDQ